MRPSRPGWTLLELVVVLGILGILAALGLVALLRSRESANRMTCLNHLRQLGLAVHSYHEAHNSLPPYSSLPPATHIVGDWWGHLLPYADQQNFYDLLLNTSPLFHSPDGGITYIPVVQQNGIREVHFALLTCPSDPSPSVGTTWVTWSGTSNYLANWYVFGNGIHGCYGRPRRFQDIADGLSNTVLFAEGYAYCDGKLRPALTVCCAHNFGITSQLKPSDDPSYLPEDYTTFQIRPPVLGPAGCFFWRTQTAHDNMPVALADGSAHLVSASISPSAWKEMLKPSDGGPTGE